MTHTRTILFAVATILSLAPAVAAAETVTSTTLVRVTSRDGGIVAGTIDARSNGDTLYVRCEGSSTVLLRPVAWTAIDSLKTGATRLSSDRLRQAVIRGEFLRPGNNRTVSEASRKADIMLEPSRTMAQEARYLLGFDAE
ncbi:MAG: hypothetical protein R3C99_15475 [Pirellulaceae bacterium]